MHSRAGPTSMFRSYISGPNKFVKIDGWCFFRKCLKKKAIIHELWNNLNQTLSCNHVYTVHCRNCWANLLLRRCYWVWTCSKITLPVIVDYERRYAAQFVEWQSSCTRYETNPKSIFITLYHSHSVTLCMLIRIISMKNYLLDVSTIKSIRAWHTRTFLITFRVCIFSNF